MMKFRKPKRYAEGGDVKTPMKLVMPSAGYMPGKSAEHMYFQPDTAKIEAAATAAADAAAAAPAASTGSVDINANTSASGSESGGNAKGGLIKMKKMAKGGAVKSSRGDGCAMKGKTKGRMV
jgi:hypothetical protein